MGTHRFKLNPLVEVEAPNETSARKQLPAKLAALKNWVCHPENFSYLGTAETAKLSQEQKDYITIGSAFNIKLAQKYKKQGL